MNRLPSLKRPFPPKFFRSISPRLGRTCSADNWIRSLRDLGDSQFSASRGMRIAPKSRGFGA